MNYASRRSDTDEMRRETAKAACPHAAEIKLATLCRLRQANAGTHACHAISTSAPGVSTVWGMRGTWSLSARSCSTCIRDRHARLFEVCDTMQSFMNQGSQKDVMNFVSDCLDCDVQLVGGGQQMRPEEEEGTDP